MASQFLFKEALWAELETRIPQAKIARAAVAYLGSGASSLLPLKKGDMLVVDMSLRTVRSGSTDPREVRKFLRKGVKVFSRDFLHAKFFIIDKTLIAGSANISNHAKNVLDEAAVLTNDPAAVRRARETFDQLRAEPIRKDYLETCIAEYRPPSFVGSKGGARSRRTKIAQAKLWIIGGLQYRDLPEREAGDAERILKDTSKELLEYERSKVDFTHYPSGRRFFKALRKGDWIILCTKDRKGVHVSPPARFLGIQSYARGKGKRRYLLLHETRTDAETISWSTLRRAAGALIAPARRQKPRTLPITNQENADALLRLWDSRGRFKWR